MIMLEKPYEIDLFDLQLFADAGTLTNAIPHTVNSYTGAVVQQRSAAELKALNREYWSEELLDNLRDELTFARLGEDESLGMHQGTTVNWTRIPTLPDADILSEGVIPEGKKFSVESINVSLVQYGLYVTVSDKVQVHAIGQLQQRLTAEVGDSLGRAYDKVVRAALLQATHLKYADAFVKSTGVFASTPSTRYGLTTADATFCGLSPDMCAKVVTEMTKRKAKPFKDDYFLAIIHPSVYYDLRRHPEFIESHKYSATTELFKNEVGELSGVRFIRSNLAPVIRGAGLTAAAANLKVKTAIASPDDDVAVLEAITAAEATALVGRKVIIGTAQYTIDSATAGVAGSAAIKLTTNIASAAVNDVIYPGEGGAGGAAVYPCIFLGKNAFKVVRPDGMGIEHIAHDRGEIGGPLNQFATIGGKFETAAKITQPDAVLIVECVSSFSMIDESNL